MTQITPQKPLPFEPRAPKAATIAAMREARAVDLPRFETVEALFADLNADDSTHQKFRRYNERKARNKSR